MITVTVLTKNSQKTIAKTLDSLSAFKEVILLDSGSNDNTLRIAEKYPNVSIHATPFLGFGPMHNYAIKLATYDWILSIDSDEILSEELSKEILELPLDDDELVYQIRRHNYFNDKHIKGCSGWHPDKIVRLFHRKTTRFSTDLVHEKVLIDGCVKKTLASPLLHTPYTEISDFLKKMQKYTDLFAEQNHKEPSSVLHALIHSWSAFIKSYILKRGFLAGREGLIISLYNGHTAFYKYLKLAEKTHYIPKTDL